MSVTVVYNSSDCRWTNGIFLSYRGVCWEKTSGRNPPAGDETQTVIKKIWVRDKKYPLVVKDKFVWYGVA